MGLGRSDGEEGSRRRRRTKGVSKEDFLDGGVVGLGGFCLRHCAISSQWLNRAPLPPRLFRHRLCRRGLLLLLLLSAFLMRLPHLFALVSRLTRSILFISCSYCSGDGDAVLGLSPVTCAQRSRSVVAPSHFVPKPRQFCIFSAAMRASTHSISLFVSQLAPSMKKNRLDHCEAVLHSARCYISRLRPFLEIILQHRWLITPRIIRTCLQYRCNFTPCKSPLISPAHRSADYPPLYFLRNSTRSCNTCIPMKKERKMGKNEKEKGKRVYLTSLPRFNAHQRLIGVEQKENKIKKCSCFVCKSHVRRALVVSHLSRLFLARCTH